MKINFTWKQDYSVGDRYIDLQHRKLFKLANAIPEVLGERDVKDTIMQLYEYTRAHFTAEEAMMQQADYPKLDEHRKQHENLIAKLNLVSKQDFSSADAVFRFKKFVYSWLVEHIMKQDMAYCRFNAHLSEKASPCF